MDNYVKFSSYKNYTLIDVIEKEFDFVNISKISKLIELEFENQNLPNLIFNLEKIIYIDSSAFGFLVNLKNKLLKKDKNLILICSNSNILRLMHINNLPKFLKIFKNIDEALEYLNSQS